MRSRKPARTGPCPPASTFRFLYPGIELVDPGQEGKLRNKCVEGGSLVPMSEAAFDAITQGLQTAMPLARDTVRRIEFWPFGMFSGSL